MKVLILSISDLGGGAARAAYRLHQGLLAGGIDSQMLVQNKLSGDRTVIAPKSKIERGVAAVKPALDQLLFAFHRDRDRTINIYSSQWLPNKIADKIAQINPDIINIHWVCGGFIPIEALSKLNKPLVWTLHDMWAFTGGCHYSGECDRYRDSCGACPQLGSTREGDLSRWIWQRKAKAWKNIDLTIVTPSKWLAKCARSSSLFKNLRVEVIPHGLDTTLYSPRPKNMARKIFNLPQDKQLILFGAINSLSDRNKGFELLQKALQNLRSDNHQNLEIVVFGASESKEPIDLGFKIHYLGKIFDCVTLSLMYSAADVMIVPSRQESFGQTAFEAMACGTPVVAFDNTGLKDIVDHEQNGYLARPFDTEDLARGIVWVLDNREKYQKLSDCARKKAEREFASEIQARRYLSLYTEVLEQSKSAE